MNTFCPDCAKRALVCELRIELVPYRDRQGHGSQEWGICEWCGYEERGECIVAGTVRGNKKAHKKDNGRRGPRKVTVQEVE